MAGSDLPEHYLLGLAEHLPVAVFRTTPGPQGRFIGVNGTFVRMFRYDSLDEVLRHSPTELYADPTSRGHFSRQLLAHGTVRDHEVLLKRRDGSTFPCSMTAVMRVDARDNALFFDGIIDDITERKRLEEGLRVGAERLAEMARIAGLGGWEFDLATRRFVLTDEAWRILGLPDGFDTGLDSLLGLHPPAAREELRAAVCRAQQRAEPFDVELPCRAADGRQLWVRNQGRLLIDGAGRQRMAGTIQDITVHKEAELSLQRARDAAEAASRAKSAFLAHMSHELRTPLNAVLGFAQLLQMDTEDPLSPGQAEGIDEILRSSRHLLRLINEILDLSRIEAGRFDCEIVPVGAAAAIAECVSTMRPVATAAGVVMTSRVALPPGCTVLADPLRLKQVLLNLLSNAIKYNRPGGTVEVDAAVRGRSLRMSIADSGVGIPADRIEAVFEPFHRIDDRSRSIEGTGIGLSIVKAMIGMMRGEIGVESTPGSGSTFWVELPLGG